MSTYIKLSTLQYPFSEGDIRLEYPEISEELTGDDFPCPDAYAKVLSTPQPLHDGYNETYEMVFPELKEDGKYYMKWAFKELSEEEKDYKLFLKSMFNGMKVERL